MKCKYKKFLKAAYIDYGEDYCGHRSGTFTKPTVTTPIIIITGTAATIACAISGATIYYTLDGSTPTSSSTEYTGVITLTLSCTIKAIAVKLGMSDSEVASESYVHYLTAWRLVGNSSIHTDPYLTSWKVSGNSVVDNNTILSCGDLGQDGKYHVKISNGIDVFDIPLTEPLRKVNNVVDTIEFPSETEGKALVTRNLGSVDLGATTGKPYGSTTTQEGQTRWKFNVDNIKYVSSVLNNVLSPNYETKTVGNLNNCQEGIAAGNDCIWLYDEDLAQVTSLEAKTACSGVVVLFEHATPTTELIDVSPFPVSSTDTYTSANETPYSAFEYKKNVEIWSCGEYSEIDNKYHIVVLPQGKSPVDIALNEPLRKVNDVADTIEFPSETEGKALVTRVLKSIKGTTTWTFSNSSKRYYKYFGDIKRTPDDATIANILSPIYQTATPNQTFAHVDKTISIASTGGDNIVIYDADFVFEGGTGDSTAFSNFIKDYEIVYELKTATTELVDAPQIEETESYTCEISQGGKAVSWSSFETE